MALKYFKSKPTFLNFSAIVLTRRGEFESKTILVINVHLPWEKASLREKAIVDIVESISSMQADYTLIMGDFNSSEESSVYRFLTNEQSLLGADAYCRN